MKYLLFIFSLLWAINSPAAAKDPAVLKIYGQDGEIAQEISKITMHQCLAILSATNYYDTNYYFLTCQIEGIKL